MNFSAGEWDLIVRGLFALQKLRPLDEHQQIQDLLNRLNCELVFKIQKD